jgi:hypothetical protein
MYKGSDLSTYEICTEKTRAELKADGFTHYRPDPHSVDNITIAKAYWEDMADEEAKANAALIACAPEMYEMLEKILAQYEMDRDDTTKVIDLLAKARGEA